MKKVLFAFTCLCGLCGCLNMNDDSTIDESSIVITRGKIRDVYVEAYVDVEAKGLKGIDVVLPNKETGYNRIHEMGYTMIYEVYDSQGKLVEKRTQDLGKYDSDTPALLHQGIALIALFLYPGIELREGSEAMLRILETELPFNNDKYLRGLNANVKQADADILWECLQKCRSQTPLPNCENALHILLL